MSRISGFEYVLKMTKHKILTYTYIITAQKCRKTPRKRQENAKKTPRKRQNLFAHRNDTLIAVRNELYKYVNHCISSNDNEW